MQTRPSILVTEDSRFLRTAVERTLKSHGFSVQTASEGEEALAIAAKVPLDLIVLDMVLPRCQGFEVLTRLKQNPLTADIPVLIVSKLKLDPDTLATYREAGVLYVEKTQLFLNELVTAIEMALQFGADRKRLKFLESDATAEPVPIVTVQ